MLNKYNIGDNVKTNIHFTNDKREVVDATIIGIRLIEETGEIRYKISFGPEKLDADRCTGCEGYVREKDIIDIINQFIVAYSLAEQNRIYHYHCKATSAQEAVDKFRKNRCESKNATILSVSLMVIDWR